MTDSLSTSKNREGIVAVLMYIFVEEFTVFFISNFNSTVVGNFEEKILSIHQ